LVIVTVRDSLELALKIVHGQIHQKNTADENAESYKNGTKDSLNKSSKEKSRFRAALGTLHEWLKSPPRPIKEYQKKWYKAPLAGELGGANAQPLDADPKNTSPFDREELRMEDDEVKFAKEQNENTNDNETRPESQAADATQHNAANNPNEEKPSWWSRRKFGLKGRKRAESNV
ncbi:MAG: hypothetical protein Q9225_008080, partial [Loekoesia sp. 1 TL-2023]